REHDARDVHEVLGARVRALRHGAQDLLRLVPAALLEERRPELARLRRRRRDGGSGLRTRRATDADDHADAPRREPTPRDGADEAAASRGLGHPRLSCDLRPLFATIEAKRRADAVPFTDTGPRAPR